MGIMISYSDLARLRMEQFWPSKVKVEDEDSTECLLGFGYGQCIGDCWFLWPLAYPGEVSEIRFENLSKDDDKEIYPKILASLGVPVLRGMNVEEVKEKLGEPNSDSGWKGRLRHVDFRVHDIGYGIFCMFIEGEGLQSLLIARADRIAPYNR